MRTKIDKNKLSKLPTVEELLSMKYGVVGTPEREDFDAKSKAWYYASVLKTARKTAGITQKQLADRIGKKREYFPHNKCSHPGSRCNFCVCWDKSLRTRNNLP